MTLRALEVLSEMESTIKTIDHGLIGLECDKWLLSSCWQKAVRRGDTVTALRAAIGLWNTDRQSLWRRLHITALEDIGTGDLKTVEDVLTATAASSWRRRLGDSRVALWLTGRLCTTVKNRMSDELVCQAEGGRKYARFRREAAEMPASLLEDYILNGAEPLPVRAIAIWYLAGTKKFQSDVLTSRAGNLEAACIALRKLNVCQGIVEACISVSGRTSWPLSIFMPLIIDEFQRSETKRLTIPSIISSVPSINGVPVYSADMFTRVGQASIRELRKSVPDMKSFDTKLIGLALFYSEGFQSNLLQSSDYLKNFSEAGEVADIEGSGFCFAEYLTAKTLLQENMTVLNDIRLSFLERGIKEFQTWGN